MRKRLGIFIIYPCSVLISTAWADATSELQNRLNRLSGFQSNFIQTVLTADGTKVQEAHGELWIQRPNLFRWHTSSPDETLLISDGETLWFYNPFVEQVTANWLASVADSTPFILIARNNPYDWLQYQISTEGDQFQLIPKKSGNNLKQFSVTVDKSGVIKAFTAIEQDGQRSIYNLTEQKVGQIPRDKFNFSLPKGVTLDDQRQR